MATYDEIYGKRVEVLDADPTLNSTYEGQVWFNSVSGKLKTVTSFAAWSSSAPTIQDQKYSAQVGTQTAALIFASGPAGQTYSEEYNGTGWTAGGALGTGRYQCAGFGIQTAAVCAAGDAPPLSPAFRSDVEEYNGTSWTEVTNNSTARYAVTGLGTLTAGAIIGGREPAYSNKTENYDGTNWTTGGTYPVAIQSVATGGTQTASFAAGGYVPSTQSNKSATYDGSSWTAQGNVNTARSAGGGAGSQTDGLFFAGSDGSATNKTENFNGTSWTNSPATLAAARNSQGGSGTSTAALATGGFPSPSVPKLTEEYNVSINTITAGAWASGGALNQGRYWLGSANQAPSNAALGFAGYLTPGNTMYTLTEEYDGTSWTEKGDLALARSKVGGAGTATAALCIGGYVNAVGTKSEVEEFNGSSWSEETNIGTARYAGGAGGTQTAAVYMSGVFYTAGSGPSLAFKAETEEYDGSSWSESGDVSTARGLCAGCGTQTAALIVGGLSPSYSNATEEYNGSSWTTTGTYPTTMAQFAGAGSQTSALAFGGTAPTPGTGSVVTCRYDGSTWSTQPNLPSGKHGNAGTGSTSAGLSFGGATNLATTEEFTGETTSVDAKTLTTG